MKAWPEAREASAGDAERRAGPPRGDRSASVEVKVGALLTVGPPVGRNSHKLKLIGEVPNLG